MHANGDLLKKVSELCDKAPDMDAEFFFDLVDELQWAAFQLGYREGIAATAWQDDHGNMLVGPHDIKLSDVLRNLCSPEKMKEFKSLFFAENEGSNETE